MARLGTGRRGSHIEFCAGSYLFDDAGFQEFPIGGSLGDRLQKPGNNLIFRTGLGYPEQIYVGLGIAF